MTRLFRGIVISVSLVLLGCSENSAPSKKHDQPNPSVSERLSNESLEGAWKVISILVNGQSYSSEAGMPETIVVSNGRFNAGSKGNNLPHFSNLEISISANANPVKLDLIRDKNSRQESLPCIIKLDKLKMTIAMPMIPASKSPNDPLPRPKSFDTTKEQIMVLTAVRVN